MTQEAHTTAVNLFQLLPNQQQQPLYTRATSIIWSAMIHRLHPSWHHNEQPCVLVALISFQQYRRSIADTEYLPGSLYQYAHLAPTCFIIIWTCSYQCMTHDCLNLEPRLLCSYTRYALRVLLLYLLWQCLVLKNGIWWLSYRVKVVKSCFFAPRLLVLRREASSYSDTVWFLYMNNVYIKA